MMADLTTPDTPTSRELTFRESFEMFSKGWIPLLATVYGFGYLVVSIYHASLGLNDINPFRAKIAAAGVLFIAINSLAIFEALYFQGNLRDFLDRSTLSRPRGYWFSITFGGLYFYWVDCLTSSLFFVIFTPEGRQIHTRVFVSLVVIDCLFASAILAGREFDFVKRISNHTSFILVSGVFIVAPLILSIPYSGQFGVRQLALYFLFVQILAIGVAGDWRGQNRRGHNWGTRAIEVLVPLLVFSLGIYPHIRAGFGGGQSISAQMNVATSNSNPSVEILRANIVDETDDGFYVVPNGGKLVRFIPRRFVNSIEFEARDKYF